MKLKLCKSKVMDNLTKQLQKVNTTHFMILNCMGTLATANIAGIKPYIKPTLETILPTLSMIKLDHVKQAYAFGKCIFFFNKVFSI